MEQEFDNRQLIVDYLQAGSKGGDMGSVGVEIEHFILDEDGDAVPYAGLRGRAGVKDILEALAEFYPQVTRSDEGAILACARPCAAVSLEPSAQIELSIAPQLSISAVKAEYEYFLFRLKQILKPLGYRVANYGYHPSAHALDLPLIPKQRYVLMDEHMRALPGMHPERMMRATCSLQVSIDFADEADAMRKMRIAALLGPILSFIADNSPMYEGGANTGYLCRMNIWRAVDPARCCVPRGLFEPGYGFGAYADWLLGTPPIFITRDGIEPTGMKLAAEAYADAPLDEADIEHLLSMFWPDVRLKRYVEVRVADSLPLGPALGYIALIKGLFYGPVSLELLEHALHLDDPRRQYREQDVEDAIAAITAEGSAAVVYGRSVDDWIDLLFRIAPEGLGTEYDFLEALKDFKAF